MGVTNIDTEHTTGRKSIEAVEMNSRYIAVIRQKTSDKNVVRFTRKVQTKKSKR